MKKRIISLVLCAVMIAVLLPFGAFADEPEIVQSGKLNDKITWTLDSDGVLRIDGTGAIPDYGDPHVAGSTVSPLRNLSGATSVVIGTGITRIGNYAFYKSDGSICATNVKSLSLSSTVASIGENAFANCSHLSSISFSEGLKKIGGSAFQYCALVYVRLPDSLESIGASAFSDTKLIGIDFGKNLKTIGNYAIGGKVEYVAIPDSVTKLEKCAFNSSKITSVTLGKGITSIREDSFPKSVKTVYTALNKADATAKYGACTNLKNATWKYSHVHSYTKTIVDPVCTTMGYTLYTCKHGDSYKSDFVPGAQDHTRVNVAGYPATYDKEGLTDGVQCSVCGTWIKAQKTIPKLFDKITAVHIDGLDTPELGKKLDYDFDISLEGDGRIITEGELAPEICWYVFNDDIADWEYIESKDYVCKDARAYAFEIYADADEHSQFITDGSYPSTIPVSINGSRDESAVGNVTDGTSLCIYKPYPMRTYDKAHTVKTVSLSEITDYVVVGDKVSDYKGGKLKGDGSICDYIWYIAKYNSKNELVAFYIPEKFESKMLAMDPSLTKADIQQLRKTFGSTFSDSYSYMLFNVQILHSDYAYAKGKLDAEISYFGLDGEQSYSSNIDGSDGINNTAFFAMILHNTKVTVPKSPEISVNKKDSKIVVSWSPVPGADKYWIYRSTDGKNFKYYDSTTKTSYTNSSVTSGTKYYYKVKAVNVKGDKEYVSNFSGYRSTVAVGVPTLTAKLSDGKVSLSWTKVPNAIKYKIYRSTDGKSYSLFATTTKTSYTNSSVNGGKYYYKIAAVVKTDGNEWTGSQSAAKSVQTIKKPVLSIEKTNGKVKLSWEKSDEAVKYWIYRSTDGGKTYKYYASTTKLSYTTGKCESGVKYYFKVKAVNADGYASQFSNAKATVLVTAPTVTAKLNSKGAAALSWDKVGGATKYYIYRSTDGVNFKYYSSTTKTSYTNTSVKAGSTYSYRVKAVTVINDVTWTSASSNTVQLTID